MSFRFYIGEDEHEVQPIKASKDAAAHYAWCLNELLQGLDQARSDEARLKLLDQFEGNMGLSHHTKHMLTEVETLFAWLKVSRPLPDNDTIINHLKGLPVGDEKYYIGYTKKI